jgi:hypothetical protein
MSDAIRSLIDRADLDGLVRLVDDYCDARDWSSLMDLRNACRAATQSGRQLWPASTLAEYRLALLAPPQFATDVLDDPGRFTIGPLTEVIAQHHRFSDMADYLECGPVASFVAHECALRGEAIDGELFDVLDIPVEITPWEPQYPLALYRDNDAVFDSPEPPSTQACATAVGTPRTVRATVGEAVAQLVAPWTESSNGRLRIVEVDGDAPCALGALGIAEAALGSLTGAEAMAWLAWAGASGGAHGRRRGGAIGRFNAWWTVAAFADCPWPPTGDAMRDAVESLQWFWWDGVASPTGWRLHVVAYDPRRTVAWALDAHDAR